MPDTTTPDVNPPALRVLKLWRRIAVGRTTQPAVGLLIIDENNREVWRSAMFVAISSAEEERTYASLLEEADMEKMRKHHLELRGEYGYDGKRNAAWSELVRVQDWFYHNKATPLLKDVWEEMSAKIDRAKKVMALL